MSAGSPELLPATPEMAERYIRLFVNNHRAYSQMTDHKDKPSSNRYFRPRIDHNNPNSEYKELTVETVRRHLHGSITCMFYAIDPQTQWSKWTCIDADYDNADPDILVLAEALENDGVPTLYETSRRGAHLWILHEVPLPAVLCRAYVTMLAKKHDVPIKGERLVSPYKEVVAKLNGGDVEAKIHTEQNGIEIFPRQDMLEAGKLGNGIRGPLGVHRKTYQRHWFTAADSDLASQLDMLEEAPKLSGELLISLIYWPIEPPVDKPVERQRSFTHRAGYKEFSIYDYFPESVYNSKGSKEYEVQCPSCAHKHLKIPSARSSRAGYYRCKGPSPCTKEQIRDALGQPIRERKPFQSLRHKAYYRL